MLLFLFLMAFASIKSVAEIPVSFVEKEWVECVFSDRFKPLMQLSIQSLSGYQEECVPYLIARGGDEDLMFEEFVREDIAHITQALSMLFEQDQKSILRYFLGEHFSLIEGCNAQIDHVGRELFGPISFYLPLLKDVAPKMGLIYLKETIFPSTQVVKMLQQHDPSVQGVTIGRVYFQSLNKGQVGCLELFQASPQDGKTPQFIEATKRRLSLLTCSSSNSIEIPIDHISIELNSIEEVKRTHERIFKATSETLIPNQKNISQNSGDGSTQTKALLRNSKEAPFNKIIEFVHYTKE